MKKAFLLIALAFLCCAVSAQDYQLLKDIPFSSGHSSVLMK